MQFTGSRYLLLALIPVVSAGCRSPSASEEVGWMRATITDVNREFEGTGWFSERESITDPIRLPVRFTIVSEGLGVFENQKVMIYRAGAGAPPVGVFNLAPLEEEHGLAQGFTAYYYRLDGSQHASFTALSGEIEITESNGDRMQGVFRFDGSLFCLLPTGPGADYSADHWFCQDPNSANPSAPRVAVAGSFSVVPRDLGLVEPDRY